MDTKPAITFCSGVGTVTGANFLLEGRAGQKILIDCGLVQGERFAEEVNREPFSYNPASIQALVITHAHLDHVGRIPKLVKDGFRGIIYSTPQTKTLTELVLNDAAGILEIEAKREEIAPLYNLNDVQAVFPLWRTIEYHESREILNGVSVLLKDAGHILGSAMVEVSAEQLKILFTGDLGNSPAPLLRDTEPVGEIDYLITESVYGDRNHEPKEQRASEFERIIKETLARGGALVIPAFSVDRAQVLLYELNNMVEGGQIPSVSVFLDSPLAAKVTDVYRANTNLFNEHVRDQIRRGDNIFDFPRLEITVSDNESRDIEKMKGAKIILAGSGMSVGGRIIGHEEFYLPDPKNTILLVGYQTAGSLGRRLAEGAKKVRIHDRKIRVRAHIEKLYGYSAHKDSDHLVEFVSTASNRLRQIFVTMGEPGASMHLAQRINEELAVKTIVPEVNTRYPL
jgi:metallo-beta-lactamase family protein